VGNCAITYTSNQKEENRVTTQLVLKPKSLSLQDLPFLQKLGRIEGDKIVLDRSPKGYKLKTPTIVSLDKLLAVGQMGLVEYIVSALIGQRPRLIPWVLENSSLINLARYLLRSRSGSLMGFYVYANTVHQYSNRLSCRPDEIIADLFAPDGQVDSACARKHRKFLEDCLAELQDQRRSPGRIHSYAKHIRTFYRINDVEIPCLELPRPTIVNKDRAPKPEELQRLIDVADLREKVIVSTLALAGPREGTLVCLRYRHVREELQKGIVPVHVHVETEITKGKYHDYDTFLGMEAVEYLRLYLDARRHGNIHPKIPPEDISDDSPLIRDEMYEVPRPIGEKQLYKIIHNLYFEAGLLKRNENGSYDLRVHSLRKFFKTQLIALGVQSDYVDYMMGHTVDTYHDIQSKGVEFLRGVYTNASLRIQPKASVTPMEQLKAIARGFGLSPEEAARLLTSSEPHRAYASPEDREEHEMRVLCDAITERIKEKILASRQLPNHQDSHR
jgi:site-specific recombinase XerD